MHAFYFYTLYKENKNNIIQTTTNDHILNTHRLINELKKIKSNKICNQQQKQPTKRNELIVYARNVTHTCIRFVGECKGESKRVE